MLRRRGLPLHPPLRGLIGVFLRHFSFSRTASFHFPHETERRKKKYGGYMRGVGGSRERGVWLAGSWVVAGSNICVIGLGFRSLPFASLTFIDFPLSVSTSLFSRRRSKVPSWVTKRDRPKPTHDAVSGGVRRWAGTWESLKIDMIWNFISKRYFKQGKK